MSATKPKLVEMEKKQTKKAKAKRSPRKKGAQKMREAADRVVGRDCKPIVEALCTNGKKGQMLSAKFLYGLAQSAEESDEGDGASKLRNLAAELANSPQWTGEPETENRSEGDE